MPSALRSPAVPEVACLCDGQKITALEVYLTEQFPDYEVHHFHAPSRLQEAGLPTPHADHHVISVVHENILPYYAVLLSEFLARSAEDIADRARQWELAGAMRGHRIVIVSDAGISSL
jgi:hypothetical protein